MPRAISGSPSCGSRASARADARPMAARAESGGMIWKKIATPCVTASVAQARAKVESSAMERFRYSRLRRNPSGVRRFACSSPSRYWA